MEIEKHSEKSFFPPFSLPESEMNSLCSAVPGRSAVVRELAVGWFVWPPHWRACSWWLVSITCQAERGQDCARQNNGILPGSLPVCSCMWPHTPVCDFFFFSIIFLAFSQAHTVPFMLRLCFRRTQEQSAKSQMNILNAFHLRELTGWKGNESSLPRSRPRS